MKRSTLAFAAAALSLSLLGACESADKNESHAGPVNKMCPVGGEPADNTVTTSFHGEKVAFCCNKCKGSFEKMTDADKSAAMAKVE